MADDYYRFVERAHILRGENTGRVYRLGDKVSVQVIKVDMERRQVDLGLTEILDRVRESERNRGPRTSRASHSAGPRPFGQSKGKAERRGRSPTSDVHSGPAAKSARRSARNADPRHAIHCHWHGRPHRSRQERARPCVDRNRSGPTEGGTGARHHDRSRVRAPGNRRRQPGVRGRAGPRAVREEHAGRSRRRGHRASGGGGRRVRDAAAPTRT